jgi:hypothetical protein
VLLAGRNGSARRREEAQKRLPYPGDGWGETPMPIHRCKDCHMVLPNCAPDAFGAY